eukprot:UN19620
MSKRLKYILKLPDYAPEELKKQFPRHEILRTSPGVLSMDLTLVLLYITCCLLRLPVTPTDFYMLIP